MGKPVENFSESIRKKVPEYRWPKTKANAKYIKRNFRLKKAEQDEIDAIFKKN